jgi:hypothetical protein
VSELPVAENSSVSAVEVLPPVMSKAEARQCIQEIKDLSNSLRAKLLDLDLRQGWAAVGYLSMTACLKAEFTDAGSKSSLIREWNAGQMEKELQVQICTYPAYQLRPLRKLKKPEQRRVAFSKAKELAGDGRLTATHFTQAVNYILNPAQFTKTTLPSKYKPSQLVRIKCAISALTEQKAWNGCWGIVQSTGNISSVRVLVGNQEVNYMAGDLDWEDSSDVQFRQTCNRILALWQNELEPIEQTLLKELQRRYFFTDLEKQMISLLEAKRLSPLINKQITL